MADRGGSTKGQNSPPSGSKFLCDFYCKPCDDDGKLMEAEGFCVDCREYLCEYCYSNHQRTRQTRHHELQDKKQMFSADWVSKYIGTESVLEKSENSLKNRDNTDFIQTLKTLELSSSDKTADARSNTTQANACYPEPVKSVKQRYDDIFDAPFFMTSIKTPVRMKATHTTDINVKSSTDFSNSCIVSSAVVSKDRLMLVDSNNFEVKLVDTETEQVISELKVSSEPWDVTIINRNQAAVSLWEKPTVLLLRVSDTLTLEREITVNGGCTGVAYTKNRLVVLYLTPPKLEIMDLSGNVMKRIENDSDGKKLFEWPLSVCVSKDDETIYVSDRIRRRLTSFTFDGVVKAVYSDITMAKMCVGHRGIFYICSAFMGNLYMLTADLSKMHFIWTETGEWIRDVCSVSHCPNTNRLYVGTLKDKLKVYQLA